MKPGYRSSLRRAIPAFPKAAIRFLVLGALLSLSAMVANAQFTSVTDGKTPTGLTPGAPAGSYPLSGFENVNLYNGNLSFRLPLLNIGGRGSAGYTMMLPLEQKWIVKAGKTSPGGITPLIPSDKWWTGKKPGYGPGVLQGRRTSYETDRGYDNVPDGEPLLREIYLLTLTRLTFTGADGTEYELRDQATGGQPNNCSWYPWEGDVEGFSRGKVFVTADGSGATFISDAPITDRKAPVMTTVQSLIDPSGYLLLKDGTRYRIIEGGVRSISDRNGNQVTIDGDTITDSLGRIVTIAHFSGYDEIQYKGFGLTSQTIRVWYDTLENLFRPNSGYSKRTYQSLFPLNNSPTTYYNPGRVANLELVNANGINDGRFYQFYYNPYGELARVVLPTGGAYEYDWAGGAPGTEQQVIFRYVTKRRVYAGNNRVNVTNGLTSVVVGGPKGVQGTMVVLDHNNIAFVARATGRTEFNVGLSAAAHEDYHVLDINGANTLQQAAAAGANGDAPSMPGAGNTTGGTAEGRAQVIIQEVGTEGDAFVPNKQTDWQADLIIESGNARFRQQLRDQMRKNRDLTLKPISPAEEH